MFKNVISIIILLSVLLFLTTLGWDRTINAYKENKAILKYVLEEFEEMSDKYVETGKTLNECMERGNKVFNN